MLRTKRTKCNGTCASRTTTSSLVFWTCSDLSTIETHLITIDLGKLAEKEVELYVLAEDDDRGLAVQARGTGRLLSNWSLVTEGEFSCRKLGIRQELRRRSIEGWQRSTQST